MTRRQKPKRNALNRGTAVYLGEARVKFVWPCGCTRKEVIKSPLGPLSAPIVEKMVRMWRSSGIVLEQCRRHPDWYHRDSQLARLNKEHPNDRK